MLSSPKSSRSRDNLSGVLFSAGIAICLVGFLARPLSFWSHAGFHLVPSSSFAILLGLAFSLASLAISRFRISSLRFDERGFGYGLLLLFLSDWLIRGYNLFQGPAIRGEILLASAAVFLILKSRFLFVFSFLTPLAILLLIYTFISESQGRLLFSDDHATFLYRLSLLKDNFPVIPFYNPFWNAGVDARDFFATGAINFFLVTLPVVYFFELESVYNYIVAFILFVLLPTSVYAAARIEKLAYPGPAIAALLSLAISLVFYRWGLKYGTMGFITAATLLPLSFCLASKIISAKSRITVTEGLLFVVTFSLMVLWSPSGLVFIPAILVAILSVSRLMKKKYALTIATVIILINLPWIALFWSVSSVNTFLQSERPSYSEMHENEEAFTEVSAVQYRHKASGLDRSQSLKVLREAAISTNPLLIIFALPGLFLLRRKTSRLLFALTAVWLLGLGTVGVTLKPQLELDRMLVILSLIACIPAAAALQKLFRRVTLGRENPSNVLVACLAGGFLLVSPMTAGSIVSNRSMVQYDFADETVSGMREAIMSYHQGGRVLFSGFVLHELSQGHLAPLAYFTGVPLMASSPVHDKWKYEQIFPRSFLEKGDRGISEYLNMYNVGAIMAHEPYWRNYFLRSPENYKKEWRKGRFVLFTNLNFTNTYFLRGEGEVIEQTTNSIKLRVDSSDATIKFNYFPFLKSSHCKISPARVAEEVTLIHLSECTPGTELSISSKSPFTRVF